MTRTTGKTVFTVPVKVGHAVSGTPWMLRSGIAAFAEVDLAELRQLNMTVAAAPIPTIALLAGKLINFFAFLTIER